jgi:hypothetical protein
MQNDVPDFLKGEYQETKDQRGDNQRAKMKDRPERPRATGATTFFDHIRHVNSPKRDLPNYF